MSTPHYKIKHLNEVRLLIVYRNFHAKSGKASHVGLGINGLHTARVLQRWSIETNVVGVWDIGQLEKAITVHNPTHVLIEAPWVPIPELAALLHKYPNLLFVVRVHSQVAFLQVEAGAVTNFREGLSLQDGNLNLRMAGNSPHFCDWARRAYNSHVLLLPNLYDHVRPHAKLPRHQINPLRVGSFGATRLQKNHATAAAATLLLGTRLGVDVEFHISVNRTEHGLGVVEMMRNMYRNLPHAKLVEVPWEPWSEFRRTVAHMHLTCQLSNTETFNIVTADSIAEGVPAVVSSAIDWVPSGWQVENTDSAAEVARVGANLIQDALAPEEGLAALAAYVSKSTKLWGKFLQGQE